MHPQLDMFSIELYYLFGLYAIVLFDTSIASRWWVGY